MNRGSDRMRFRTRKETTLAGCVTNFANNGKRWLTSAGILVLLAVCNVFASAQATSVISGQVVSLAGVPQPYAKVRVCTQSASGIPCTPLASVWADPGLTVPLSNPVSANQYGTYSVFVSGPALFYQVQTTYGTTTYPFWANGQGGYQCTASTLCPVINVLGQGVVAGGTLGSSLPTDTANTTAIQAAIDLALETGAELYFPCGVYNVNSPLTYYATNSSLISGLYR